MSLAVLYSRAAAGMDAPEVVVEAHLANGLPSFTLVGLPETEVKEARDRVRAAILQSSFEFPARRISVNLAPADLPQGIVPLRPAHRARPARRLRPDPRGQARRIAPGARRTGHDPRCHAHHRILNVARTLADLDDAPAIAAPDIAEAIQYRRFDHA